MLDGPLNTYQDFKNVFNAKNVGSKTNRRHAPSSNQSRSIAQDSDVRGSRDSNLTSDPKQMSAEKERKRAEKTRANIEASYAQKPPVSKNYPSVTVTIQLDDLSLDKQDSLPLNSKKIEEDYTMFDEQIENDD